MKRILLCCTAGMSTSMLVNRMRQSAGQQQINVEITATGIEAFTERFSHYNCRLSGLQHKYRLKEINTQAAEHAIPATVINSLDYGMVRSGKTPVAALQLIA